MNEEKEQSHTGRSSAWGCGHMEHIGDNMGPDFDPRKAKGFGWRVSTSIITAVGWLSFLLIWLGFYAGDYNIYQNIAAVIVSLIVFIGINGAVWATWAMRMAPKEEIRPWRLKGIVSFITGAAWVAFLLIWLLQYAGDYNGYQNLAVLLVSLLVLGGINGVMWNHWSRSW
jgi:hypothetical protein